MVPHLVSGSCASPRAVGLGFLQTPPHGDALALLLAFGSAITWREDSHLARSVPCLAHTMSPEDWIHKLMTDPELTRCISNHDHRAHPVVGSFHERSGPGKRQLLSFHCPSCGVVTGSKARPDYWREHPTIKIAMSRGNVLPCAL